MELVKGVPITEYCDANNLPTEDRLKLFITVCQAVQHAHQKGIIHRDLKPSNILVTLHDGQPVVKVIDFGVAKAINQQLTEKTLFTAYGQMVGTPQYMSPGAGRDERAGCGHAKRLYSLGVLLYELLTGTTPLEGERLQNSRLRRDAADHPGGGTAQAEHPAEQFRREADDHRQASRSDAGAVCIKLIRGDLDWIVMKSLEKDRRRRYESAASFAADIERFLSGQTVEAHPPSSAYRLRKFVRRYRLPVMAGSVVTAALVLGLLGSSWG